MFAGIVIAMVDLERDLGGAARGAAVAAGRQRPCADLLTAPPTDAIGIAWPRLMRLAVRHDAHERAAATHERVALVFDRVGKGESARRERARARVDRDSAVKDRQRARLRREWVERSREHAGGLGADGQVGMKPGLLTPADPSRQ